MLIFCLTLLSCLFLNILLLIYYYLLIPPSSAKFNVQNLEDLYDDFNKIDPAWIEYLALLERAKKNLNNNMEYFKNDLLEQAQVTLL